MSIKSDVDIDFYDRSLILSKIPHIVASRMDHGQLKSHNTGVYFHKIPVNPLLGISNIDFETAKTRGYFKIDFLNVSAYKDFKDEKHLEKLLQQEPMWELLHESEVCDQLFQISGYHSLLKELNPCSIEELAMVLALIRPGKKHLVDTCKSNGFSAIADEIWKRSEDAYYFKKSHAISYAHVIVAQLNLICERALT